MPLLVYCVPASDGVAVAPCGTVDGQALSPVVLQPQPEVINYDQSGQLFATAFGVVMFCFVLGHLIGSILRVIRAA
jgi:hypothetical protein